MFEMMARLALTQLASGETELKADQIEEAKFYAKEWAEMARLDARVDPLTYAETHARRAGVLYIKALITGQEPENDVAYARAYRTWKHKARAEANRAQSDPDEIRRLNLWKEEDD